MSSLSYSVEYYISLGLSNIEAEAKVLENKTKTSAGLQLAFAKRRIQEHKFLEIFTIPELLEFEKKFIGIKYFGPNTGKGSLRDYLKLKGVMDVRNLNCVDALEFIRRVESKFPNIKSPKSNTKFILELFGENSEQYAQKLEFDKNRATCSFDVFSKDYDDKELAYTLFCEKYGSNNKNHMLKKGYTEEEIIIEMAARADKARISNNSKSDEEKNRINKSKAFSLENFINRFGEILGTVKHAEALAKKAGQSSLFWYIEKYGVDEGNKLYQERKGKHNSVYCYEYWVHRGETEESAKSIVAKMFAERPNFSLDYCREKYGLIEGYSVWKARNDLWQSTLKDKPQEEIDLMNSKKAVTIGGMIEKYGEEEGNKRFSHWLATVGGFKTGSCSSKSANRFFLILYRKLRKLGILDNKSEIYLGIPGSKEFNIFYDGKIRFYDFTIPKLKVIVEYNGTAWHAREGDYTWTSPYGRTYQESIDNDTLKLKMANDKGYDILYVWDDLCESDELIKAQMFIIDKV